MKTEWRETTWLPGYEINRDGKVRNTRTHKHLPWQYKRTGWDDAPYVVAVALRPARASQISVLLFEAFGPDAPKALGLETPNMSRVYASRASRPVGHQKSEEALPTMATSSARKCHDCGRQTSDYRCKTCWDKIRQPGAVNIYYAEV